MFFSRGNLQGFRFQHVSTDALNGADWVEDLLPGQAESERSLDADEPRLCGRAEGRWRTLATPGESFSWFSWLAVIMVGAPAMFNFNLH